MKIEEMKQNGGYLRDTYVHCWSRRCQVRTPRQLLVYLSCRTSLDNATLIILYMHERKQKDGMAQKLTTPKFGGEEQTRDGLTRNKARRLQRLPKCVIRLVATKVKT